VPPLKRPFWAGAVRRWIRLGLIPPTRAAFCFFTIPLAFFSFSIRFFTSAFVFQLFLSILFYCFLLLCSSLFYFLLFSFLLCAYYSFEFFF